MDPVAPLIGSRHNGTSLSVGADVAPQPVPHEASRQPGRRSPPTPPRILGRRALRFRSSAERHTHPPVTAAATVVSDRRHSAARPRLCHRRDRSRRPPQRRAADRHYLLPSGSANHRGCDCCRSWQSAIAIQRLPMLRPCGTTTTSPTISTGSGSTATWSIPAPISKPARRTLTLPRSKNSTIFAASFGFSRAKSYWTLAAVGWPLLLGGRPLRHRGGRHHVERSAVRPRTRTSSGDGTG